MIGYFALLNFFLHIVGSHRFPEPKRRMVFEKWIEYSDY